MRNLGKNNYAIAVFISGLLTLSALVYAAPSQFNTQLLFTEDSVIKTDAMALTGTGRYKPDQNVVVRVTGSYSGDGDLQYLGVAWVKIGSTDIVGTKWAERCPTSKICVKEITLPGKASDYRGYEVLPTVSGVLDGKLIDEAVFGGFYPIPVAGASIRIDRPVTNVKPAVKLTVDESTVARGGRVKITAEATAEDRDLKSITVNIAGLPGESTAKSCSHKELEKCKLEFKVSFPYSGSFEIEAIADDLGDLKSDTAKKTVTVNELIKVVKGELNVFTVDSTFNKWLSDEKGRNAQGRAYLINIPGAIYCSYSYSKAAVLKTSGVWKSVDLLYEPNGLSDTAVVIYCSDKVDTTAYEDDYYFV